MSVYSNDVTSSTLALDTSVQAVTTAVAASQPRKLQDGSGNPITSTGGALDINIKTPTTLGVTQSTSPWTVAGTVTANAGTGNFTVVQPTGTNLHVTVDGNVNTVAGALSNSVVSQVVVPNNTNTTLVAANPATRKVILYIPSANTFVKLGATASATSFTYDIAAAKTTLEITNWAGQIDVFGGSQTINVTVLS